MSVFLVIIIYIYIITRSFDDGLSECGLTCPPSILAIDKRLDSLYAQQHLQKGKSINLQFPCY